MIAWRIGWVVAPRELVNDVSRVHIYNGLVPSGFAQIGTRLALGLSDDHLDAANVECQRRRDETPRQLDGLPVVAPGGGWSLLLDVSALGLDCAEVSDRLLEQKVAATPMRGWGGEIADRHVRFVFSNEPVDRLAQLGTRVRAASTPPVADSRTKRSPASATGKAPGRPVVCWAIRPLCVDAPPGLVSVGLAAGACVG